MDGLGAPAGASREAATDGCRLGARGYHRSMDANRHFERAVMWERDGAWIGVIAPATSMPSTTQNEVTAPTREACLKELRRRAGRDEVLTVEVLPALAGVAEAAAIMGWDKRRVITYLRRGSFPEPFAALASGRVWRREDVEAFAASWRARRRKPGSRKRT